MSKRTMTDLEPSTMRGNVLRAGTIARASAHRATQRTGQMGGRSRVVELDEAAVGVAEREQRGRSKERHGRCERETTGKCVRRAGEQVGASEEMLTSCDVDEWPG